MAFEKLDLPRQIQEKALHDDVQMELVINIYSSYKPRKVVCV